MKTIFTLLALTIITNQAFSQIIYDDITDMVLTASANPGTNYDLDIDGNGADDFKINMRGDLTAGYGNFIAGSFSTMNGALEEPVWGDALHLISGDTIGANSTTWSDFTSDLPVTIYAGGASYGQEWLVPVTDGYFAFKFEISGNLHYGWLRMDVSNTSIEMTIKDWAYNSTPDEMILAGQTSLGGGTSISSPTSNDIQIYQAGGTLTINTAEKQFDQFVIYDLTGKVLAKEMILNPSEKVDLSSFTSGIYSISLIGKNEQAIYQQKISILK